MEAPTNGLESKQYQETQIDPLEALFKQLLESPPPRKPSVISRLETHKRLITRLISHGYNYKQLSEFMANIGIKASAATIAQVARGKTTSKTKRVPSEGAESA